MWTLLGNMLIKYDVDDFQPMQYQSKVTVAYTNLLEKVDSQRLYYFATLWDVEVEVSTLHSECGKKIWDMHSNFIELKIQT